MMWRKESRIRKFICGRPSGWRFEPRRMMVLEDSQTGCRAAVAAGAFAVAVPGGHSRGHDFSGTAFVAESLADPRIYAALGLIAGMRKIAGNERK